MYYSYYGLAQWLVSLGLGEFRTIEDATVTFQTFHTLGTGGMLVYVALITLICAIVPYLLSSVAVPRLYCRLIGKMPEGKRIELGDVWRGVGKWHTIACIGLELLLAYLCIQIGALAVGAVGAAIAGFFCVMGETLPIWHKMRGTRGFEMAAICALILSPPVFAVLLLIWGIVLLGMRYATAARVFPTLLYPLIARVFMMNSNPTMVLLSVAIVALMLFSHWKNIRAMMDREEPRLEFGKNKRKEQ